MNIVVNDLLVGIIFICYNCRLQYQYHFSEQIILLYHECKAKPVRNFQLPQGDLSTLTEIDSSVLNFYSSLRNVIEILIHKFL